MMYENFISSGWAPISFILVLFLFCFGLFAAISPRAVVLLGRRWRVKGDPEPGATTLLFVRLAGILMLLIALALVFLFMVAAFLYHYEY